LKFTCLTLFPELIESWSKTGLVGGAIKKNLLTIETLNPRKFTSDIHQSVDDTVYGGSDGMVLKFEPLAKAIESLGPAHVVFLTPQGTPWTHAKAQEFVHHSNIVLVCGRYAGFDQRLIETFADDEISIGDYILNGGEVAALAVMESVARLIPGVLGNKQSVVRESFAEGLLEAPAFTRPREVNGMPVPSPLLSGNHALIAQFEHDVALVRTRVRRPELLTGEQAAEAVKSAERLKFLSSSELKALGLRLEDL
jgi:tRNA (guanine37-N1)-methyltransferase